MARRRAKLRERPRARRTRSPLRIFRLPFRPRKPERREFLLTLWIVFIQTILIGAYGYILEFLAITLSGLRITITLPPEAPLYMLAIAIVIAIMTYAYGKRAGWW